MSVVLDFNADGMVVDVVRLSRHEKSTIGDNELSFHKFRLPFNRAKSPPRDQNIGCRYIYNDPLGSEKLWERLLYGVVLCIVGFHLGRNGWDGFLNNDMRWWDWLLIPAGLIFWCVGAAVLAFGHPWPPRQDCNHGDDGKSRHEETVSQKVLTGPYLPYYNNYMANVLGMDKQIAIVAALCEGSSIRAIGRMTGVHRDTIMRLGVRVGQGCAAVLDAKMRNLSCEHLQLDEIWGFIGKKDRNVRPGDDAALGSVWTWTAIDADTKLVPSFAVGKRTRATADAFIGDIASRMKNRVQLSADALSEYVEAIEAEFGANVDFAQIIKSYVRDEAHPERQYSPSKNHHHRKAPHRR